MRAVLLALCIVAGLVACDRIESPLPWKGQPGSEIPNAAGLVSLPCDGSTPLAPVNPYYCRQGRHFVTPDTREALIAAATAVRDQFPAEQLRFMDASGPEGVKPFPPHLSHGDGRQIDLALYFLDRQGQPMDAYAEARRSSRYWPAEPPRPGEELACPHGREGPAEKPDPPAERTWRLDEARTKALIEALIADRRVKRILIEPHLERRLGFWGHPKLRFAGCRAARHDDHLHVDFY